ncbi:hypothetical protein BVG16_21165 [Paenibacillus selenitireducens]|uniref:Winged helix-turn-helix domain-containing protein n=1 Tax=Paenibacillus selenitireducens TaxID=1324314 RepID=A0A1T2X6A0_9BACL|nr:crosslink repair DNA glycosylase YcaQ family protein [Paenibacillus selenitireducens]OPA75370.1 hypothetical protein BVG16_21165 [Paenibacillus selenitireducens]
MLETITLTKLQARRFLLYYHGLLGKFQFTGKEGVMSYIRRVGCIQFDPLNVVGMNPELVLQSRIQDFDRNLLWDLLYKERRLIDYWDKNMSIFPIEDWPYFWRCRKNHQTWCNSNIEIVDQVYAEISNRGYLCSGDIDYQEKIDWSWGATRLSRAALEGMYHAGYLGIHHKVNTRKYYDLAERLIPKDLYTSTDPFQTNEQYYEWYVLRRIGSIGLLWNRPSDAWLGINGLKSLQRNQAFEKLMDEQRIIEVKVEGMPYPFYIRSIDINILHKAMENNTTDKRSSILAPLDNLLWDRTLIKALFDFEYRWEVYKPVAERKYGYYVLPVLYDDQIVARFEPLKHTANEPLFIKNWWWEDQTIITPSMKESIKVCLERFATILGTHLDPDFKL